MPANRQAGHHAVPLWTRARVFSTGQGRKTDATDAHAIAVVALRTPDLLRVRPDDHSVALRMLADRRDELGVARTATVSRLHRLLLELIPGGARKFLSVTQARTLLATVRPRDLVGKTRRQLAAELIAELATLDKKIKAADKQLTELLSETGTGLTGLYGIGPSGAARLLGDIGDVPDRRPLRLLERHRTHRCLQRRSPTPSTLPCREPENQPSPAHHGHRAIA
jgi:transposase